MVPLLPSLNKLQNINICYICRRLCFLMKQEKKLRSLILRRRREHLLSKTVPSVKATFCSIVGIFVITPSISNPPCSFYLTIGIFDVEVFTVTSIIATFWSIIGSFTHSISDAIWNVCLTIGILVEFITVPPVKAAFGSVVWTSVTVSISNNCYIFYLTIGILGVEVITVTSVKTTFGRIVFTAITESVSNPRWIGNQTASKCRGHRWGCCFRCSSTAPRYGCSGTHSGCSGTTHSGSPPECRCSGFLVGP